MANTHFSGPVISAAGFQEGVSAYESVITTKTIAATDNGKTFGLNLAGGFTVTLPDVSLVSAGFKIKFRVEIQPTTAYIITELVGTDTDILSGSASCAELTDAAVAAGSAAFTLVTLVASAAIVGDWVTIESNGTRYFVHAHTNVQAGVTFT